jgi:hypothetical protein
MVSERWIKECKSAIKKIRKLTAIEDKDRLERVKAIKTSLGLMGRSLSGCVKWINNPNVMAKFSEDELENMENNLSKIAETFIKFDIKTTELGQEKGIKKRRAAETKRTRFVI